MDWAQFPSPAEAALGAALTALIAGLLRELRERGRALAAAIERSSDVISENAAATAAHAAAAADHADAVRSLAAAVARLRRKTAAGGVQVPQ